MAISRRVAAAASLATCLVSFVTAAQAQDDPSFRINNRGRVEINEVYVSSSANQNWGNDRLGQNTLPPGSSVVIRLRAGQCMNDIRVVYANGQSAERRQVNTCQITDMAFP